MSIIRPNKKMCVFPVTDPNSLNLGHAPTLIFLLSFLDFYNCFFLQIATRIKMTTKSLKTICFSSVRAL